MTLTTFTLWVSLAFSSPSMSVCSTLDPANVGTCEWIDAIEHDLAGIATMTDAETAARFDAKSSAPCVLAPSNEEVTCATW